MKKIFLAYLVFMMAFSTASFAQKGESAWSGKGTKVVNLGIGFGSVWNTVFKLSGLSSKSFGPIAAGFEYGVTDKIGVGLQIGYSRLERTSSTTTDRLTSFMIQARGNYHFSESEKFDPYIGVGVGYNNFNYKSTTASTFNTPTLLGYTTALGARYYVSKNIGVYGELGYVTGAFFQVGLAAKF